MQLKPKKIRPSLRMSHEHIVILVCIKMQLQAISRHSYICYAIL